MLRLNLGCGLVQPDEWTNVDVKFYGSKQIVADILRGLPFPDSHFDFVLMNHVLQMFTYNEHEAVLKEVRRVMKPGATLRILTPDLLKAVSAMVEDDNREYFPISDKLESTIAGKFARYLFWHGETRCAFSYFSLSELLEKNGYGSISYGEFGECELDSRKEESLIVTCQK